LLTDVARRLHPFGDLHQVVALTSLDASGHPAPPEPKHASDPEIDR
jgi:hypothetical protein